MSRGRGIHAYWNLQKILDLIGPDMNVIASGKWVAQKECHINIEICFFGHFLLKIIMQ